MIARPQCVGELAHIFLMWQTQIEPHMMGMGGCVLSIIIKCQKTSQPGKCICASYHPKQCKGTYWCTYFIRLSYTYCEGICRVSQNTYKSMACCQVQAYNQPCDLHYEHEHIKFGVSYQKPLQKTNQQFEENIQIILINDRI